MATRRSARARRKTSKPSRPRRPASKRAGSRSARRGKAQRARGRAAAARPRRAGARRKPAARPRARTRTASRSAAAGRIPSGIGLTSHHMDYTCHDMEAVHRFYIEILGFARFDFDPDLNYLYVQTGPSSSLGFMPPMQGPPEQWRPPREPALYFLVADVDRAYERLRAQGVVFDQAPQDMPWGHRVALLHDPEGRRVCLAQPLKR